MSFKLTHTLEKRKEESEKIQKKYPMRVPIICEKNPNSKLQDIDKVKFLVPKDISIGQFSYVIRKRLKLKAETALFLLINNKFPSSTTEMIKLYDEHKNEDGFLYITYNGENAFG